MISNTEIIHLPINQENDPVTVVIDQNPSPEHQDTDNNKTETCLICYNDYSPSEMLSPLDCKHNFCINCFKEHIDSKMQAFQVLNIHCPQEGCPEIFTDANVRKVLDETGYNRYQDLVLKKMAYKNTAARVCPKPGCARPLTGLTNIDTQEDITCICGTQICFKCLNFSHPGKSCLQAVDPEFEIFAQDNDIRYCIICKTPVSRVEGCLHMTCCVCDYEWCWACGKQYDPKHVCTGNWSPSAPSIYENKTKFQKVAESLKKGVVTVIKSIVGIFIVFPIFLICCLIFWPYEFFRQPNRRRRPRPQGCCKKIGLFILSGLIGIVLLPVTIAIGAIFFICSLPKTIKQIRRRQAQRRLRKKQPKRWMLGNAADFKYTDAARPTANAPGLNNGDNDIPMPEALDEIGEGGPAGNLNQSLPIVRVSEQQVEVQIQALNRSAIELSSKINSERKEAEHMAIDVIDVVPKGVLEVPEVIPSKEVMNDSTPLDLSAAMSIKEQEGEKTVQLPTRNEVDVASRNHIDGQDVLKVIRLDGDKVVSDNENLFEV